MKEQKHRKMSRGKFIPFTSAGYLFYLGCRDHERRQQKFLDSSPSRVLHFSHSLHIVSHVNKKHFDLANSVEKSFKLNEVTNLIWNLRKPKWQQKVLIQIYFSWILDFHT